VPGRRYPLEAARTLRRLAVTEAEAALGKANSALGEAAALVKSAREAAAAHAIDGEAEEAERRRREDLGAPTTELLRAASYGERRRREGEALRAELQEGEAARDQAERAAADARRALATANAEEEVVERHHEDFRRKEKGLQQAREEAEAEDLVAARRHQKHD